MSNHIHWVAQAAEGENLIDIIRDFKKFTARQIIDRIKSSKIESRKEWLLYQMQWYARQNRRDQDYQLWQSDNHPIQIISPKFVYQKIGYIHQNPVEAGLVMEPAHYVFSSASFYEREEGILPVIILDPGVNSRAPKIRPNL